MNLGDFRKLTKDLSDDTDIVICYRINEGSVVNYPMENVRVDNREKFGLKNDYSEQVIYVDEDDCLMGYFDPNL